MKNCGKTDRKFKINNRTISENGRAFIVAEAACNHLCDMKNALRMIDDAYLAKADAIKFQTYTAEKLTTKKAKSYGNIKTNSQYEYYKQFEKFGRSEYETLFEYSSEKGIIAFSTPFDPENAQMLNSLDMPLYKIASCDLLYKDLLREVACFQKPIILSTGGSTLEEINKSLEILYSSGAEEIALLACTLSYPTKTDDANYRKITKLINEFPKNIIGISDHVEPEEHMISGPICLSLGAKIFEKHFTLDRTMGGGSSFSMNPKDLQKYVRNIHLTERLLGENEQKVYEAEKNTRNSARRSLVANVDLDIGTIISKDKIGVKRPGTGILPDKIDDIVGLKVKTHINEDEQITWEKLEQ